MVPSPFSPDDQFVHAIGPKLGGATSRVVYEVVGRPDLAIKVSIGSTFANWCEYMVSTSLQSAPLPRAAKPGHAFSISQTGRYLVTERLSDLTKSLAGAGIPSWLNDAWKAEQYGENAAGEIKIRDYGMLKIGDLLGQPTFPFEEDRLPPLPRVVQNGLDEGYAALQGAAIGSDGARSLHELIGYPDAVLKVCVGSHEQNVTEQLVYSSLQSVDAEETSLFGWVECSQTGKYLVTERLRDLTDKAIQLPPVPRWLMPSSVSVGMAPDGAIKFRSYYGLRLGDVLRTARVRIVS